MTKEILADIWDDRGRDKRQQKIVNSMEACHMRSGAAAFSEGKLLFDNPWNDQHSPLRRRLWERGWTEAQDAAAASG